MADVLDYLKGTHPTVQALFKYVVSAITEYFAIPGKELIWPQESRCCESLRSNGP